MTTIVILLITVSVLVPVHAQKTSDTGLGIPAQLGGCMEYL